jgi:hypothetical protein
MSWGGAAPKTAPSVGGFLVVTAEMKSRFGSGGVRRWLTYVLAAREWVAIRCQRASWSQFWLQRRVVEAVAHD